MAALKIKSDFIRNILTLISGTGIAQFIPIAMSPILTRIYTPEDFGIFALYVSISSIVAIVATGRYELAIILPKREINALHVFVISVLCTVSISILSLIFILFFSSYITDLIGKKDMSYFLYFIPITILFSGFYQSFNYWMIRKKKYRELALNKVAQSTTTAITNFSMGSVGVAGGLIFGNILGQILATYFLGKSIILEGGFKVKKIKRKRIVAMLLKYIDFPKYNSQHALISSFFSQLPIFVISNYFGAVFLGYYSLSLRVIQLPLNVIGNSLSSILYQKIVGIKNSNEKYMSTICKFFKYHFVFSLLVFAFILFISNYMGVVFGQDWVEVGLYIKILLPWLFMVFIVSPLSFSINMTNNQIKGLKVELCYGAIKMCSLLIGAIFFEDVIKTLIIFSLANSVFLIFQGFWFFSLLKINEIESIKEAKCREF